MAIPTNAFTLSGAGYAEGIETVFHDSKLAVVCTSHEWRPQPVFLEAGCDVREGRLMSGKLAATHSGTLGLVSRQHWPGMLIRIQLEKVTFPFGALLFSTRLWLGAEPHTPGVRLLAQAGERNTPDQDQLLAVRAGEPLLVIDRNFAAAIITFENGRVDIREATALDGLGVVQDVLRWRREHQTMSPGVLRWAATVLEALKTKLSSVELIRKVDLFILNCERARQDLLKCEETKIDTDVGSDDKDG